jgi:aspartate-semialdehyde dehydrogenase
MKFDHLPKLGRIAIVGANSMLGKEVLSLLDELDLSPDCVAKYSIPGGVDEDIDEEGALEAVDSQSFSNADVVLFATPADVTRRYLPHAQQAGSLIWDFSGAFHSLEGVPMVVPGINESDLLRYQGRVASGPTTGAVPLALALQPFLKSYGIKSAIVSTYQPASELGNWGFEELSFQSAQMLNGTDSEKENTPHPLAFNCIPWIGEAAAQGESSEEWRLRSDTERLLGGQLALTVTAVRVPTFYGFGASVYLELDTPLPSLEPVRDLLDRSFGLKVWDKPESQVYPTNRECSGADVVFVGRLRQGLHHPAAISFFLMSDNLRRGAALNALEGIEYWLRTKHPAPVLVHPGNHISPTDPVTH